MRGVACYGPTFELSGAIGFMRGKHGQQCAQDGDPSSGSFLSQRFRLRFCVEEEEKEEG
jgi:hypothetical protein